MSTETKEISDDGPLSDADVENTRRRLQNVDADKLNTLYRKYSNVLSKMMAVTLAQAKEIGDEDDIVEVERLKRLLALVPIEEKLIRTKDKIWKVREHIIKKNASYFLERDYGALIKKDQNQAMIETLVDVVKTNYEKLSDKEKKFYWTSALKMLKCVIEFMQLTGEHT